MKFITPVLLVIAPAVFAAKHSKPGGTSTEDDASTWTTLYGILPVPLMAVLRARGLTEEHHYCASDLACARLNQNEIERLAQINDEIFARIDAKCLGNKE
jgi:hypothetical protein